jgi:hypothetical protein
LPSLTLLNYFTDYNLPKDRKRLPTLVQEISMTGIPSHLIISLREILSNCEQFETNRDLRNLFADQRIVPWRNNLPQADTVMERVENVIGYLHDKSHRNGSNALLLLLMVLTDTISPGDDRHERLKTLASNLAVAISQAVPRAGNTDGTDRKNDAPVFTGEANQSVEPRVGTPLEAPSSIEKRDFFISYNRYDRQWAEWIAWQLENAGYTTFVQSWDFRPGGNFVAEMHKASMKSERTIAVLSQTYLASQFTQAEWNAAFARDPTGKKGLLVPVKVRECNPQGLLSQIVYIDLTGLSPEQAMDRLLDGVKQGRGKPPVAPNFPGGAEPKFPDNS